MIRALIYFLLFTLADLCLIHAQNQPGLLLGRGQIHIQDWDYDDFVKNGVTSIEAYTFVTDGEGNLKKDSVRLFKKTFVKDSLLVTGSQCDVAFTSNGEFYPVRDSGKKYFDETGLLIKTVRHHRDSLEYGKRFMSLTVRWFITEYTYDDKRLPVSEKTVALTTSYWIGRNKDTSANKSVSTTIYRNEYDEMGQRTRSWDITDSTRIRPSVKLDQKRLYDERGNTTLWITYTAKGGLHTKRYYEYDAQNRPTLQVDSTGWFYTTLQPYREKKVTYQYPDTFTTITTTIRQGPWVNDTGITTLTKNTGGKALKYCSIYGNDSIPSCIYNTFENGRLTSQIHIGKYGTDAHTFTYYPNGLLFEEKVTDDGKLTGLVRYIYR